MREAHWVFCYRDPQVNPTAPSIGVTYPGLTALNSPTRCDVVIAHAEMPEVRHV